ncbi:hypothetical protein [Soonwooa sp.]|uniref:hypothetical protein n=1 Tax=Soonwooa sp. TaxID=1938592 RepID=UPI0026024350|nr:hypothetical protein [Soonwooa sp.]
MESKIIQLIPVIDIFISNAEVKSPSHGPYWEYQKDWNNYNTECLRRVGLSENMTPYLVGSSFYEINKINQSDLLKLILLEIEKQQTEEEKEICDLVCSFEGGYILKIEGENILFPQCCSNLADIQEWENLTTSETISFYSGHPSPQISKMENSLLFDFENTETNESFCPPILHSSVVILISDLKDAVATAKTELKTFSQKLELVNDENNLNIKNIAKILIYGENN